MKFKFIFFVLLSSVFATSLAYAMEIEQDVEDHDIQKIIECSAPDISEDSIKVGTLESYQKSMPSNFDLEIRDFEKKNKAPLLKIVRRSCSRDGATGRLYAILLKKAE